MVHGFLTENGNKISKSRGGNIDPIDLINKYGADAVRHYLLAEISSFNDGDFSIERFEKSYNTKLANSLGNLVSRLTTLCQKASLESYPGLVVPPAPVGYHEALQGYQLDKALETIWAIVTELNQDIDINKPWILVKEKNYVKARSLLIGWLSELEKAAYWLAPFLPVASQRIHSILAQNPIVPAGSLFPRSTV